MSGTKCFLRMNANPVENATALLNLMILRLQQKENARPNDSYVARPWALLFVHKMDVLQTALKYHMQQAKQKKRWLSDIRICQVESIHELRAVLCALHVSDLKQPGSDLIHWIQKERDGQPPGLVVVMDLARILSLPYTDFEQAYLHVRRDDLAKILALLVETCDYLGSTARQRWQTSLGQSAPCFTDLLITDDRCLDDPRDLLDDSQQLSEDGHVLESLFRIIAYYMDQVI